MAALWDRQICEIADDLKKDAPRKENGSSDFEITISDYGHSISINQINIDHQPHWHVPK